LKNLSNILVSPHATIAEAIRIIDQGAVQIALVTDSERFLLGTLTDGDIRRGLLRGETLESEVERCMHRNFITVSVEYPKSQAMRLMREKALIHMPVLDAEGHVVQLFLLEELSQPLIFPNWVVLMAGGYGKRLRPLTDICPKPMLLVGGKPMLEIILEQCIGAGFRKFFISVNYLKQQIIEYFGNGSRWQVDILYIEEDEPLGTAGALGLLPERPDMPILVMNGDVLTSLNHAKMLLFHKEYNASATICVCEYKTTIPYGVVMCKGEQVLSLDEKPELIHNINTGVYILNPDLLKLVHPNQHCDMPQLLVSVIKKNLSVIAFPIHEYWLDVGQKEMLSKANGDWQ
jgi:dTDP-glucose pyrophosphorylase